MSLQYVIDGYNIINHRLFPRATRKIRGSPAALINLINSDNLCGSLKNKITIVFDGYPAASCPEKENARIRVIFSRNHSADEVIKKIIEKAPDYKNTVVVSDDKEIAGFVKSCRVKTMGAGEFLCRPEARAAGASGNSKTKSQDIKPELNYSQIAEINAELKKLWRIS
jgi:predicted RNA-binding protein with PIN domain